MARSSTGVKERSTGMHSLMRLLPFAKPFTWSFVFVVGLVIIFNATSVLQPYLVKIAIDRDIAGTHPNFHGLLAISGIYVGVVLVGVVSNYLQVLVLQHAGQSIIRTIRLSLFRHIEKQSMSFFDRNAIGRLVTNVSSDTETVSQFFTNFFLSLIRDGLSLVMILIAMFELNVQIAAYSMVMIPILFGISLLFRRRLRIAYQTTRSRLSNIVSFLAENLAGMRIIQIFHQERRQESAFETLNASHRQANVDEYTVSVMLNRSLDLLGNAAVAAVVWVGGGFVVHGLIQFGTLYAFISYIRQFFQPINSITQQWNTLQSSMVAAERIGSVLEIEPDVRDPDQPLPESDANEFQGTVSFEHVSFGYEPGRLVLHDIHFSVGAGDFIGIVGPTGAGKSSIISLLTRFYDPVEGAIFVDGMDIRKVRQKDLHRWVGLVQQDVYLFTGTVADNIRLFRPDITDQEVVQAAEAVGANAVIDKLPDGYQTRLYGRGTNLSMGERQLISFARVVALNPRVLILDEATASLDSQTEELVSRGLRAVSRNRTTLVIAHRLATIRHADLILVLDQGEIVERGDHGQLLALNGQYADLHRKSGVDAAHAGESVAPAEVLK